MAKRLGRWRWAVISVTTVTLVLLLPFRSFPQSGSPPLPQLHGNGDSIVNDKGQTVVLHGCNLGNWLLNEMWMMDMARTGEPGDQWLMEELLQQRFGASEKDRLLDVFRENWIRPRDFRILKTWKFNVARLPFNYTLLQDDATPDQLRPNAFHWLDRAIDMATQAGIYVIVDMHGAPGRQSTDQCTGRGGQNKLWLPENRKRAAFLWKKIAERYQNSSTVAAYDLLNEPYGNYGSEPPDSTLVSTMDELIHAIREVDTKHLIFCAGNLRGTTMYGPPESRGWKNVGYTEHFYPGLFGGGDPTLETHARFIGRDLRAKAQLYQQWKAPFLAGEFNVVFEKAGGGAMMRRYYDIFASHGWAGTMWSYKIIKHGGECHPDNWYLVTNLRDIAIPSLRTASKDAIENFFKTTGRIEYAQDDDLRAALTSSKPPALALREYPVLVGPAPQDRPPSNWQSADLGELILKGGQRVFKNGDMEIFGGGRDVFEGADQCHFVWQKAPDHFVLCANVTPPFDSQTYAKAGLMYRASLDPSAPIVIVTLFPDGTCNFAFRRQAGARITETTMLPRGKPQTLRLVRDGAKFEAAALDADGKPLATQYADLPELVSADANVGLFVLSHEPMFLSKAAFTNIQFH